MDPLWLLKPPPPPRRPPNIQNICFYFSRCGPYIWRQSIDPQDWQIMWWDVPAPTRCCQLYFKMFVGPLSKHIQCLGVPLIPVYWIRAIGGYICGCGWPSNLVVSWNNICLITPCSIINMNSTCIVTFKYNTLLLHIQMQLGCKQIIVKFDHV